MYLDGRITDTASSNESLLSGASGNACLYSDIKSVTVRRDLKDFAFMSIVDTIDSTYTQLNNNVTTAIRMKLLYAKFFYD